MKLRVKCGNCNAEVEVEYRGSRTLHKKYFIVTCSKCKEIMKVQMKSKEKEIKKEEPKREYRSPYLGDPIPNLLKDLPFRIKYF
jgi:hypothetical protein